MTFNRGVAVFIIIITLIPISSCEKRISCDSEVSVLLSERLRSGNLESVNISYSWTGGYGSGDIYATLRSDSISTVRVEEAGNDIKIIEARLVEDNFNSFIEKIVKSGFLCLKSIPRETCIADMGTYSVTTQIDSLSKEIFVDGENAVHELDIFISAIETIHGFGEEFEISFFDWGPYGTSTIPCQQQE